MYDAIIAGARCAGSPVAMLLARRGYRVLLVDKASFPSDTLSTHYIQQTGAALLDRWGLLSRLRNSGAPPIRSIHYDFGPFAMTGNPPAAGDVAHAIAPRRTVLDKILLDAAIEAGAEVRESFSIQELVTEDGRVTGIRGRDNSGATVTESCRVLVGPDGIRSSIAKMAGAISYNERPSATCLYYSYFSGVPCTNIEIFIRPQRVSLIFPTNDGLTLLLIISPNSDFQTFKSDLEGSFDRALDAAPALQARIRSGKREERIYGTADVPNYFRRPYGDGWALSGDAGYHRDPCTAQGITDAFTSADLVSEAIDAALSGRLPWNEAMGGYENRRNAAAFPMYELTAQRAALAPPTPDAIALLTAIAGTQELVDQFAGVEAGTVPVAEFFSPQNLGMIMAGASSTAAGRSH